MNKQTIIIVVIVVALVHAAFFYFAARTPALQERRRVPRPNFNTLQEGYRDAETGEAMRYQEFTVSTKLADPAKVKRMEEEIAAARAKEKP